MSKYPTHGQEAGIAGLRSGLAQLTWLLSHHRRRRIIVLSRIPSRCPRNLSKGSRVLHTSWCGIAAGPKGVQRNNCRRCWRHLIRERMRLIQNPLHIIRGRTSVNGRGQKQRRNRSSERRTNTHQRSHLIHHIQNKDITRFYGLVPLEQPASLNESWITVFYLYLDIEISMYQSNGIEYPRLRTSVPGLLSARLAFDR